MDEFLAATEIIDWKNEKLSVLAEELSADSHSLTDTAQRLFEWVRDNVQHSTDFNRSEVTCRASDVLKVGTGFCYAKSHLLAALLRSRGIPTGFCYQRLSVRQSRAVKQSRNCWSPRLNSVWACRDFALEGDSKLRKLFLYWKLMVSNGCRLVFRLWNEGSMRATGRQFLPVSKSSRARNLVWRSMREWTPGIPLSRTNLGTGPMSGLLWIAALNRTLWTCVV